MIKTITAFSVALLIAFQLSGCVGGGGATGSSGSAGESTTPTVTLAMTDPVTGANKSSVSAGDGAIITATVRDASNRAVERAPVAFSVSGSSLSLSSEGRLTDVNGVATVNLTVTSITQGGKLGTITAATSVGTGEAAVTVTSDLPFEYGPPPGVRLEGISASLTNGATSLSSYATTSISVSVVGVPTTTTVPIGFTSTCAATGKATITAQVNSRNGVATATYADNGCASTDMITASVAGTTVTASLQLPVSAPSASAIQFVSAAPTLINIRGGKVTSSTVSFKLVDNNRQPISGQNITLGLTNRSGGILLNNEASGTINQTTDADGVVRANVTSGTTPVPVTVTASHTLPSGVVLQTQSSQLQITTGRPVQDRFSFAVETWNIEGLYQDGETTNVTIIASDRVGNPVDDGIPINFQSDGGQIEGNCITLNGTCSAVFKTASPRPANGRVVITAYADGEETFRDANGNNIYDAGELFHDLGEVYRDKDFNRSWSMGEQAVVFNGSTGTCTSTLAGMEYAPSKAGTCDGVWGTAHVRKENIIVLSGNRLNITSATTTSPGNNCLPATATFFATDENQNPLPAGTTLEVSNLPAEGWAATILPSTVQNSAAVGVGTSHQITFTPTADVCGSVVGFSAAITATTPKAHTSTATNRITVLGGAATAPAAPSIGILTAGVSPIVSITFTAPTNTGGAAITSYTATCSGAGVTTKTAIGVASPISVTMDAADVGETVTCTVRATNSAGTSSASGASNSVVIP